MRRSFCNFLQFFDKKKPLTGHSLLYSLQQKFYYNYYNVTINPKVARTEI